MNNLNADEQIAASVVASLSGKRDREDSADAAGGVKKVRDVADTVADVPPPPAPQEEVEVDVAAARPAPPPPPAPEDDLEDELMPAPFYYYKDFSTVSDPDSLTPLTPPGRVPNFPAKMHAILSRSDLTEIVCWLPHGRAWKVLKPREFEVRVIPTYFEHAKFSSFIRQANGWGFRRITHGKDRNSYYHPLFLRALPHLCKEMKRPGVAKKLAADPEHEPDLQAISDLHPVPTHFDDESILLHCTIIGGPKARMPIYSGALTSSSAASSLKDILIRPTDASATKSTVAQVSAPQASALTPHDRESLSSFSTSLGASEMLIRSAVASSAAPSVATQPAASVASVDQETTQNVHSTVGSHFAPPAAIAQGPNLQQDSMHRISTLAAANELAFGAPHSFAAAYQASSAASQFAAGFAAAAALSHQQFQNMIQTMQQQQNAVAASQLQQQQALEALQNLLALPRQQQGDL